MYGNEANEANENGNLDEDLEFLNTDLDGDNLPSEPVPHIDEEKQHELLRIIRENELIAVPLEGVHLLNRQDAIYYYEGKLDQVSDPYDRMVKEEGRSVATSMLLAETVETMLPSIVDILTNSKTIKIKKRKGQSSDDIATENEAIFSVIYDENDGWQVVHDALWDAATGRYGCTMVYEDKDNLGEPAVCISNVHPADVSYVPTAVSYDASPYWGVIIRMPPDEFKERYGLEPDEFSGAPVNDSTLDYDRASTSGTIVIDSNIALKSHYLKLPQGYLNVITDYQTGRILEFTHHECLMLQWWNLYRRPHSLVGWSVYDRVKGTQKAQTALQRLMLDQYQFAQVNRPVIGRASLLPETISQLQTDAPGVPVIVNGQASGAIVPLYQSGQLPLDIFQGFEYFSADAEAKAGVGRNMQGVNAEALHESMTVGMVMEDRQQMRVRTIARSCAQMSVVPLFTAVHCLARQIKLQIEVNDNTIDCSTFGPLRRISSHVDIKGGTSNEQIQANTIKSTVAELVAQQKGASDGPFITGQQILNAAKTILQSSGVQDVTQYVAQTYQAPQPQPPQPDPHVQAASIKAQADTQNTHAKIVADAQTNAAQLNLTAQQQQQQLQQEYALKQQQMEQDFSLQQQKMQNEIALKREQMLAEIELKKQQIMLSEALSAGKEVGGQATVGGNQQ